MSRTWEQLVADGRRAISKRNWLLGDLALEVETGYGKGSLKRYADEIEINYESLKNYRWVAAHWEKVTRVTNVPWAVHRELATLDDRHEVIKITRGWTVASAREYVERQRRPDFKPSDKPQPRLDRRAPITCPNCGARWSVGPRGSVIPA
jgi:hypothetical protein